ncbi:hypothetical protein MA16_Dca022006 [Dendrobium catenatum]|uniref:Uncharacterized protein n=1 Tax=Dendrobium catenatum TaxID=906689 RepID=A0A2I0WRD5_9ASPA|nr:hypothetical protein MA16_Dca022006 [Dendrobium catenatum]
MEDGAAFAAVRRNPPGDINLNSDYKDSIIRSHKSGSLRINEPSKEVRKIFPVFPGKAPTARRISPHKITSTFPGAAESPGPLTPKRSSSLVNLPRDKP